MQPEQAIGVPEPPSFITGYAADEWLTIAPELHCLGLLTKVDIPALAAYCHAYGQWRMAAEALARMAENDPIMSGQIIKTKYGDAAANPLVSIARKHAADVVRYANEFGLTAAARSRMGAGGYAPPTASKFGDLFGSGAVVPLKRGDGKTETRG